MERTLTLIGFGEAGMAFAPSAANGYDVKLDGTSTRAGKAADFARLGVAACASGQEALRTADAVLSVVTADQALSATYAYARHLRPGTLWFDLNSISPETKRSAAIAVDRTGRYVDVAVMAPVRPAGLRVPLLVSGPHARAGADALLAAGFTNVRIVGDGVGRASAIKMIRSVMVKGMEALAAECALAADAAGVLDEVVASLDASETSRPWVDRLDYALDRMMVHGIRRAAEMDEVVTTLDALGTGATMSRGTMVRQHALGRLSIAPPVGLAAKLAVLGASIRPALGDRAA